MGEILSPHPQKRNGSSSDLSQFLLLIWYELIAYTCNLIALDFVSGG